MTHKRKQHKHRILGVVKPEHLPDLEDNPFIEPLPADQPTPPIAQEEHVVLAVPKSLWSRIKDEIVSWGD